MTHKRKYGVVVRVLQTDRVKITMIVFTQVHHRRVKKTIFQKVKHKMNY